METLPVEFVNSLLRLRKPPGTEILLFPLSVVDVAREGIVSYALQEKFDYVLFIDSDMVFRPDILGELLERDKDIITALAFKRKPPYSPCIYKTLRLAGKTEVRTELFKEYEEGVFEVEGCGLACCLIKTEVFKAIYEKDSYIFSPYQGYGEDLTFCLRARNAGFKIYADTTLKIGHIGQLICTEETYKAWSEMGGDKNEDSNR